MHDKQNIKGRVEITLRDSLNNVKPVWKENWLGRFLRTTLGTDLKVFPLGQRTDVLTFANSITNVGHAASNGRMSNQGGYSPFVNLALGIGTQGTPATATGLASEITTGGGDRVAATTTQVTTSVANDTTQLSHTWTFSGSFAITEEGVFDSATPSSGSMALYQSFSAVNVISTDQLTITHKYQT